MTDRVDEIQSLVEMWPFMEEKTLFCNYSEKRKEKMKYRWIYCIDYWKVKNFKLMAIIANGELKINKYIMCEVRKQKRSLCCLCQISIQFLPCKCLTYSVYQNCISKFSSYLILSTFRQTIKKIQSQELLITFLLLRFNKHLTGWHCALKRDGWSLMDVYTYTNNSIVTVQNWKLF